MTNNFLLDPTTFCLIISARVKLFRQTPVCVTDTISLQSRRNFVERMLSIFQTKILTAIFDFSGSGRESGKRKKYVPKGRSSVKNKERGRVGEVKITVTI